MRSSVWLWLACIGCSERVTLIDHGLWSVVDAANDPFDDRPDEVFCPSSALAIELDAAGVPSYDITTGVCSYLLVSQPSLATVRQGQRIDVQLLHDRLTAEGETEAEAHLVVKLGDLVLFELREPIPADFRTFEPSVIASDTIEAGTPVLLHLHNHGTNTWNLYDVTTGPDR